MKIELRNVKYAAFASQETSCFEAAIYIDGKREGEAHNDGHGGSTSIHPYALQQRLDAYAKTLPRKVSTIADETDASGFFTYEQSGESLVDDALTDYLITRDLKRDLKTRLLFVRGVELRQAKPNGMTLSAWLAAVATHEKAKENLKADAVLNFLPFSDALALYRRHAS
jgi:hypothetical protein